MKKKILGIVTMFVLCVMVLCGCFTPLNGLPNIQDSVSGNGGLVAQKGKYLYFVNGHVATSTLKEGDNKGNEMNSALYRVKLGDNGELVYNEDGELENVERVVSKIAGFDNVGIYIYDDYVYYATPVTKKDNLGTILFNLTEICRVKLDGSNNEVLYTTTNASDNTTWAVYKLKDGNNTKTVLAVYDGKNVFSKVIGGKTYTLAENVTSAVLPKVTDYVYNTSANEEMGYAYYTRDAKEDEISYGNVLARCSLLGGEEEILQRDGINTYEAVDFVDNRYTRTVGNNEVLYAGTLYVTVKNATVSDSTAMYHEYMLYSNSAKEIFNTQIAEDRQLSYLSYSKILFPEYEGTYSRGAIAQDSNGKIVWIKYNATSVDYVSFTGMDTETLTLLSVKGDFAYVSDSANKIYRINYKTGDRLCVLNYDEEINGVDKAVLTMKNNIDMDEDHIYFFRTFKGNDGDTGDYLVRANTVDNCYNVELVGELETAHKYVEPE